MLRHVKEILFVLLLALNVITLFSLLITFVPNFISLLSILKKIGLSVIFACTILLVVAFVCVKLLKNDSAMLATKEYNILIGSSLVVYLVFAVAFQISAALAGWEKGSDIYMANSFSSIFPFFSGIATYMMKWIFAQT